MKKSKSCGIIPFVKKDNELFVLLIKQTNGVIGFPKGHVEPFEKEEETALRECFEETNVRVTIVNGFKETISYYMPEYDKTKVVVYFVGLINELNINKQEKEIDDIYLCTINDALNMISYAETKELLIKAVNFINNK